MQNQMLPDQTIGQFIRELRQNRGIVGIQVASKAGISQSKLSKLETDTISQPRTEDVNRILDILQASEHQRQRARWLMGQPRPNYVEARPVSHNFEESFAAENQATLLQVFALHLPALIQTPAVQASILDQMTIPTALRLKAQRLLQERQDRLWDLNRQYHIVMYESALYSASAGYDAQVAQIDRIERMLDLPNIKIGIISFTSGLTVADPCNFVMYDSQHGLYEQMGRDIAIRAPDEVEMVLSRFDSLARMADYNLDAMPLLIRAKTHFQNRLKVVPHVGHGVIPV